MHSKKPRLLDIRFSNYFTGLQQESDTICPSPLMDVRKQLFENGSPFGLRGLFVNNYLCPLYCSGRVP